jgi:hypothetical protein
MPHNVYYSFYDVNNNFRRAGVTLLHSRMWTEAPLNNFKMSHLYPCAITWEETSSSSTRSIKGKPQPGKDPIQD